MKLLPAFLIVIFTTSAAFAQKEFTSLDEALKTPEAVKTLNLSGKGLTVLPASIGKLVNLEKLNVSNNKLSALPKELAVLKKLKSLNLTANAFTSFPTLVLSMSSLEDLEVSFNAIGAIPKEISKLTKLKRFSASKCGLKALPAELKANAALEILDFSYNSFTTIPVEITELIKLRTLDVSFNKTLAAYPPEMKNLEALRLLNLKSTKVDPAKVADDLSWLIPNCQVMQ